MEASRSYRGSLGVSVPGGSWIPTVMSSVRGRAVEAGFRLALTVFQLPSGCEVLSSFPWDAVKSISVEESSAAIVEGKTVGTRGTPLFKTDLSAHREFSLSIPGADPVGIASCAADCDADAVLTLLGSGGSVVELGVSRTLPALHVAGACALLGNAAG